MKTTYLYLFIHENSKWTAARWTQTVTNVCVCVCARACVYSYIPNNTTPFSLNLLSQINFTDI